MWGCLGNLLTLMIVLLAGLLVTVALGGAAAAAAISLVAGSAFTASFPGIEAARITIVPPEHGMATAGAQHLYAFNLSPGEWIFITLMTLALVLTLTLMAGILSLFRHRRRREPQATEETVIMQELHQLALRMDERIESLETLMLGHGRRVN